MSNERKFTIAIVLIGLLVTAWMARIDATPAGPGGLYVTDRWTGTVLYCGALGCQKSFPQADYSQTPGVQ